jgi:hypothetical protein
MLIVLFARIALVGLCLCQTAVARAADRPAPGGTVNKQLSKKALQRALDSGGAVAVVRIGEVAEGGRRRIEILDRIYNEISVDYAANPEGDAFLEKHPILDSFEEGAILLVAVSPGVREGSNRLEGSVKVPEKGQDALIADCKIRLDRIPSRHFAETEDVLRIGLLSDAELAASRSFTAPPRKLRVYASIRHGAKGLQIETGDAKLRAYLEKMLDELGDSEKALPLPGSHTVKNVHGAEKSIHRPGEQVAGDDPRFLRALQNRLGRDPRYRYDGRLLYGFIDHVVVRR